MSRKKSAIFFENASASAALFPHLKTFTISHHMDGMPLRPPLGEIQVRREEYDDMYEAQRVLYLPNALPSGAKTGLTPNSTMLNQVVRHGLNFDTEMKEAGDAVTCFFLSGDVGGGAQLRDIQEDGTLAPFLSTEGYHRWLLYIAKDILVDWTALPISEKATPVGPGFFDVDASVWTYLSLTQEHNGVLMLSDVGTLVCRTIWEAVRKFYPSMSQPTCAKLMDMVVAAKRPMPLSPLATVEGVDGGTKERIRRLAEDLVASRGLPPVTPRPATAAATPRSVSVPGSVLEGEGEDEVDVAAALFPKRNKGGEPHGAADLERHEKEERMLEWKALKPEIQEKFLEYMPEVARIMQGEADDAGDVELPGWWLCKVGLHIVFPNLMWSRQQGQLIMGYANKELKRVLAPYRAKGDTLMTEFGVWVDAEAWKNGNKRMIFSPKCKPCAECKDIVKMADTMAREQEAGGAGRKKAVKSHSARGWRNAAEKRRVSVCGRSHCVLRKEFVGSYYVPVDAFMVKEGHLRRDVMRMAVAKGMEEVETIRNHMSGTVDPIVTHMSTTKKHLPTMSRGSMMYADLCAMIASRNPRYMHSAHCESDPMFPLLIRMWTNLITFSNRADGPDGRGVPETPGFLPPSDCPPLAYAPKVEGGPADARVLLKRKKMSTGGDRMLRVCQNSAWTELDDPEIRLAVQSLVRLYKAPNPVSGEYYPHQTCTITNVYANNSYPFIRASIAEADCINCQKPGHTCGPIVYFNISLRKSKQHVLQQCTCCGEHNPRIYGKLCKELRLLKETKIINGLEWGMKVNSKTPIVQRHLHHLKALVEKEMGWNASVGVPTVVTRWSQVGGAGDDRCEADFTSDTVGLSNPDTLLLMETARDAMATLGGEDDDEEEEDMLSQKISEAARHKMVLKSVQAEFGAIALRLMTQEEKDDTEEDALLRQKIQQFLKSKLKQEKVQVKEGVGSKRKSRGSSEDKDKGAPKLKKKKLKKKKKGGSVLKLKP